MWTDLPCSGLSHQSIAEECESAPQGETKKFRENFFVVKFPPKKEIQSGGCNDQDGRCRPQDGGGITGLKFAFGRQIETKSGGSRVYGKCHQDVVTSRERPKTSTGIYTIVPVKKTNLLENLAGGLCL